MSTMQPDPHGACTSCECELDVCAFCDEPGCAHAMCYACVGRALAMRMPHAHPHGG